MADEKKVSFSGVDNGLSSMMDKLRAASKAMAQDMIRDSTKYANTTKEQVKYIKEQIDYLEKRKKLERESERMNLENNRKNGGSVSGYDKGMMGLKASTAEDKMQVSLLREVIDTIKNTAKEEIKNDRQSTLDNIRDFQKGKTEAQGEEDFLKKSLQEEYLKNELNPKEPKEGKVTREHIMGAVLGASLLRDAGKIISQMPNANTGLDLLSPSLKLGGMATGGAAGLALNAIPGVSGAEFVGSQVGESVAGFVGTALERSLRSRESYYSEAYGVRGITGNKMGGPNIASYGVNLTQSSQIAQQVALTLGNSKSLGQKTADFVALQKGYGLNQGLISGTYGQERMGVGGSGIERVAKIIALATKEGLFKGGDTTSLADILSNQNALLQTFSESAEKLNPNSSLATLMEFNKMGGGFKMTDPRSMGRINGINSDLANASSPFSQAANYMVLRKLNPDAGLFDLQKRQQQGLQTPGFLKGVMDDITGIGGSEDFQKLMLASRLPSLNLDSIDTLYKNRANIGSMNPDEIASMTGDVGGIRGRAAGNVNKLSRYQAETENAFIDNFSTGIKTVKNQFVEELGLASKEIAEVFKEEFGKVAADLKGTFEKTFFSAPKEGDFDWRFPVSSAYEKTKEAIFGKKPNTKGGKK